MSDTLRKLQGLKALADVIKSGQEAQLAEARATEQSLADQITSMRAKQKAELSAATDLQHAAALEGWLGWSRAQIQATQAEQARHRVQIEKRLESFRTAFGRSAALDELLDQECKAIRRKRNRP